MCDPFEIVVVFFPLLDSKLLDRFGKRRMDKIRMLQQIRSLLLSWWFEGRHFVEECFELPKQL